MDGTLAIILLAVCLALLLAEVFIPSGGMILITALVCLAGSIWFAYRAWWENSAAWWTYVGSVVVLIPSLVAGMLYWFPRTTMGKRILLDAPPLEELEGYTEEAERLKRLIGKRGKSITLMNPGGMALIEGERHHCESQGLLIEPQQPVEVVGTSGNRLIVRQVVEGADERRRESTPADDFEHLADDRPLDFEVPQS